MDHDCAILTFLTIDDESDQDEIVFLKVQENYDYFPAKGIHWYQKGVVLFQKDNYFVKSWSAIGKKASINNLKLGLLSSSSGDLLLEIKCSFKDTLVMRGDIDPKTLCDSRRVRTFTSSKYNQQIAPLIDPICDRHLCNFITGYDTPANLKSMYPPCHLSEDELYQSLNDKIIVRESFIGPQVTFKGKGVRKKKDLNGYEGTVYNVDQSLSPVTLKIFDNKDTLLTSTKIQLTNGVSSWSCDSDSSTPSGHYELFSNENEIIGEDNFQLIMDFKISVNPVTSNFTDHYKRKISKGIDKETVEPPHSILWKPIFESSPQFLSDELTDLFLSLGPHIIIQDPYLFGINSVTDTPNLNESSICFLNSILVASYRSKIQTISFLIDPKKLNLTTPEKKQSFSKLLLKLFKEPHEIAPEGVSIYFSQTPFHDRYIANRELSTVYSSTKSINGLLEKDHEFRISKLGDEETNKVANKISRRLSKAGPPL